MSKVCVKEVCVSNACIREVCVSNFRQLAGIREMCVSNLRPRETCVSVKFAPVGRASFDCCTFIVRCVRASLSLSRSRSLSLSRARALSLSLACSTALSRVLLLPLYSLYYYHFTCFTAASISGVASGPSLTCGTYIGHISKKGEKKCVLTFLFSQVSLLDLL